MIVESYYLSNPKNLETVMDLTELSLDEIESMVGRFTKQSQWAAELRGELVVKANGDMVLRHHFNKNIKYWSNI
jgi:hypothetical protein